MTRGTRNDDDDGIDDDDDASVRGDDDDDDDDEETNGFEIVINHDSEKEGVDAGASDGRRGRGGRPGGD